MDGKDDRQLLRDLRQRFEDAGEHLFIVDVAGAMHGQGRVALGAQAQRAAQPQGRGQGPVLEQGVDHDVADEEDLVGGHPLGGQVLVGEMVGGKKIIAEHVGTEPVDLLGHRHVPRAQPGLHMGDPDPQLLGGDGAGHGRVDVADHDDQIGRFPQADLFELHHDPRRLLGVGAAADLQIDVRLGHAEIDEKGLTHLFVVMLPGMHQQMLDFVGISVHGFDDRRHFHEIGPGADDIDDFQRVLLEDIFNPCFYESCCLRPGPRLNSRVLLVIRVTPCAKAWPLRAPILQCPNFYLPRHSPVQVKGEHTLR